MSSYFVTGAGRGIGLELVKQLAQLGDKKVSTVFAATRGPPSDALSDLINSSGGRVANVKCEVTDLKSIEAAAAHVESALSGRGLDVLVNNVGSMPFNPEGIRSMPGQQLIDTFNANVVSAHLVTSTMIPLLQKGKDKKIINISTELGSIGGASKFSVMPVSAYKITKAALNMLTVQYGLEYGPQGFTVVSITPGWLKTDMGTQNADLEVSQGVQSVIEVIEGAGPQQNGKFLNIRVPGWENATGPNRYDGGEVPW